MKIGYAAPLTLAPTLADLGYDFLEAPLFVYDVMTAAGLSSAKRSVAASPLPTRVMNNFFPRDLRVVGPVVGATGVRQYLAGVAEVCHAAGARAAVLGSAWARNVPDGGSFEIAHVQTADTGRKHPGTGSYDYPTIAQELAAAGYDGTLTVEVMHQLTVAQMRDSLSFLRRFWPTEGAVS